MKKLIFSMAAIAGFASMGAMNDTLISFSTPGPDKYADGTTVLDGECYALVWSLDGNFEGLKADGTTVDPDDEVVYVSSLAKDGACGNVLFQIDAARADSLKNGQYGVYLLDTRVKAADGSVKLAAFKNGMPEAVNGNVAVSDSSSAATSDIATASSVAKPLAVAATAVAGAAVTTETIIDAPKITGIKVDGATVRVTVAGMLPVATYKVVAGDKPGAINTELDAKAHGNTFEFVKPEGKFFKVIGTRNFTK